MGPGLTPDAPYLEELRRLYGSIAVGALPPGMTPVPNVFPPPNIGVDMVQRERERLGNIASMILITKGQFHQRRSICQSTEIRGYF